VRQRIALSGAGCTGATVADLIENCAQLCLGEHASNLGRGVVDLAAGILIDRYYEGANRHQHRSRPPQRAGSDNMADAHNSVPGMSVRSGLASEIA